MNFYFFCFFSFRFCCLLNTYCQKRMTGIVTAACVRDRYSKRLPFPSCITCFLFQLSLGSLQRFLSQFQITRRKLKTNLLNSMPILFLYHKITVFRYRNDVYPVRQFLDIEIRNFNARWHPHMVVPHL